MDSLHSYLYTINTTKKKNRQPHSACYNEEFLNFLLYIYRFSTLCTLNINAKKYLVCHDLKYCDIVAILEIFKKFENLRDKLKEL